MLIRIFVEDFKLHTETFFLNSALKTMTGAKIRKFLKGLMERFSNNVTNKHIGMFDLYSHISMLY